MRVTRLLITVAAATAAIAVTACGQTRAVKSTPPSRPHDSPLTQPVVIAALGDSITAGTPQWDPNPAIRAQMGDSVSPGSQYEYWLGKQLGPKTKVRNCGVFGERTGQIALRLGTCARGADVVIVQGGINDIAQDRDPAVAAANLRGLVRSAKRMKLAVVLTNVLPWNNGYPTTVPPIERLNAAIARIGREEKVAVADFYSALDDPAHPGRMPADMTADGDHPSIPGYRVLGGVVARAIVSALRTT